MKKMLSPKFILGLILTSALLAEDQINVERFSCQKILDSQIFCEQIKFKKKFVSVSRNRFLTFSSCGLAAAAGLFYFFRGEDREKVHGFDDKDLPQISEVDIIRKFYEQDSFKNRSKKLFFNFVFAPAIVGIVGSMTSFGKDSIFAPLARGLDYDYVLQSQMLILYNAISFANDCLMLERGKVDQSLVAQSLLKVKGCLIDSLACVQAYHAVKPKALHADKLKLLCLRMQSEYNDFAEKVSVQKSLDKKELIELLERLLVGSKLLVKHF